MPDQSPAALSRSRLLVNVIYSMVPLLGYWLVEVYYGLKTGVIAAIILALAEVIWVYVREKRFEAFSTGSAGLVIIMGGIGWYLESETMLRLKPAIFEGIFAFIIIGSSLLGKPLMLMLASKQFGKIELSEFHQQYFHGLNLRIGLLFAIHTLMIVYAALYGSAAMWAFVSSGLFFIMFILFLALEFLYSRRRLRKYVANVEKQRAFLEYQRDIISHIRKPHS